MDTTLVQGNPDGFGAVLRAWRNARGLSQLDLAIAADASPRHLSFLETNRARPSRDMVLNLSNAMVLPRAARNELLVAAGFAPLYPVTPLEAEALKPLREVLSEMMRRHEPYPALLCDRHWTVLDATPIARVLLSALDGDRVGMNVVRMLTKSAPARELIVNFEEVLDEMVGRIRLEALEAGRDEILTAHVRALEKALSGSPARQRVQMRRPLVPLILRLPAGELRFLTSIAHFGTSEDVTVRDLRLELLFPADDATRRAVGAMSGSLT